MNDVADSPLSELRTDLDWAHVELAEARLRQREKDTPGNRWAVADSLARMDGLLDMYLEVG